MNKQEYNIKKITIQGRDEKGSITELYLDLEINNIVFKCELNPTKNLKEEELKRFKVITGRLSFNDGRKNKINEKVKDIKIIPEVGYDINTEIINKENKFDVLNGEKLSWTELDCDCGFMFKTNCKFNEFEKGDYINIKDGYFLITNEVIYDENKDLVYSSNPNNKKEDEIEITKNIENNFEIKNISKKRVKIISDSKEFFSEISIITHPKREGRENEKDSFLLELKNKFYRVPYYGNAYETLRELDKKVNQDGYKILCNGTSKDVFCTGLCFTKAKGNKVQRLKENNELELLNTFDCEDWNEYATQEEQEKIVEKVDEMEKERLI